MTFFRSCLGITSMALFLLPFLLLDFSKGFPFQFQ